MKKYSLLAALSSALILITSAVSAQEADWKTSYELEAAGKYIEAISALDRVPANGPDAELKVIRRGWLYYMVGNFNDSIREYRLAIERNNKAIDSRLGVILPLLAQKRWREAEQNARSVLEMAPNNYTALIRLTVAQEGQRDWTAMLKTASTLVSLYPTDATAQIYLARANAWMFKREEAAAAYAAVLVRFPANFEARAYLERK